MNPLIAWQECKLAGLPYALGLAFLSQETGGGQNEWGHDPTIFIGGYDAFHRVSYGKYVTKTAYLAYKRQRGQTRMQGAGPMQLTWWSTQDRADAMGGCWNPRYNMRVGFSTAAANIRRNGLWAGIAAYNGSGPAAQHYAAAVLALDTHWKNVLGS